MRFDQKLQEKKKNNKIGKETFNCGDVSGNNVGGDVLNDV